MADKVIAKTSVRGSINAVTMCPKFMMNSPKPRRYSMSSDVVFSAIRNDFGEAFIHVGEGHIQVIVTVMGKEVFRQVWN